jgi:hypothetical protein
LVVLLLKWYVTSTQCAMAPLHWKRGSFYVKIQGHSLAWWKTRWHSTVGKTYTHVSCSPGTTQLQSPSSVQLECAVGLAQAHCFMNRFWGQSGQKIKKIEHEGLPQSRRGQNREQDLCGCVASSWARRTNWNDRRMLFLAGWCPRQELSLLQLLWCWT